MNIRYATKSDTGRRRSENQDSVLACARDDACLFAVADGVGGLRHGAEASQAAVRILQEEFVRAPASGRPQRLVESIERANAVVGKSRGGGLQPVAGTTVVALLLEPGTGALAHVGDSRAYRSRNGAVERLTEDHSLVAEQLRAGIITEAEAVNSQHRHVVTRSLGAADAVEVEIRRLETTTGDRFLLCSDGLTDVVTDAEIGDVLAALPDEQEAAQALVELANARGGPDNVSIVLVHIVGDDRG